MCKKPVITYNGSTMRRRDGEEDPSKGPGGTERMGRDGEMRMRELTTVIDQLSHGLNSTVTD